ncbi:unnamed protein product, partial [Ixodes hexagonus]
YALRWRPLRPCTRRAAHPSKHRRAASRLAGCASEPAHPGQGATVGRRTEIKTCRTPVRMNKAVPFTGLVGQTCRLADVRVAVSYDGRCEGHMLAEARRMRAQR